MTTTFTPGKTYSTRSVGDHNCIFKITVASRTAKTLTTTEGKTLRISIYEDVEQVKPMGTYSMAPIIGADDTKTLLTDWEQKAQKEAFDGAEQPKVWVGAEAVSTRILNIRRVNGNPCNICPSCGGLPGKPFRAFDPFTCKIAMGCIDAAHTPAFLDVDSDDARWHFRKTAREIRTKELNNLLGEGL